MLLLWVYFPLCFPPSFLSMVFLLIISLENNEKLYLKVLLVFKTVTVVSSIIREMWWADFLSCKRYSPGDQQFFMLGFGINFFVI